MAIEKQPTKERKRVYLSPTGPKKVGVLPAAVAGPTRPVKKNASGGTKSRQMARPAQGRPNLQSTI
jgi:hypothetical protein